MKSLPSFAKLAARATVVMGQVVMLSAQNLNNGTTGSFQVSTSRV